MATPHVRFLYNMFSGSTEPLRRLGKFGAGASVPVVKGQLLEHTGNTNTEWVPMDSDFAMSADVAIADCDVKDGDRAGYYPIIVARPGDVFEFDLATADDVAEGVDVYWSDSETVAQTGTHVLGTTVGQEHYPEQGHLADDGSADAGTTLRTISQVRITIKASNSYYAALQK